MSQGDKLRQSRPQYNLRQHRANLAQLSLTDLPKAESLGESKSPINKEEVGRSPISAAALPELRLSVAPPSGKHQSEVYVTMEDENTIELTSWNHGRMKTTQSSIDNAGDPSKENQSSAQNEV